MIAQHRKKECCTSEEGKLKNKIMFAEILFFLPLCKPAKLCFQSFKTFFHLFAHQYSDHYLQGFKFGKQTIHWENSDKFETLKKMIAQHRKKECCTSELGKLKNKIMFAEIFFFLSLCKPAKLCFQSFKTFFRTFALQFSDHHLQGFKPGKRLRLRM